VAVHAELYTLALHAALPIYKSLVVVTDDVPPRYRLLETTRIYGLEKLADCGETERIAEAHARSLVQTLSPIGEGAARWGTASARSEEHTSELQSRENLVCRL